MEKCLQCDKVLQHVPGRRQKSFCDVNCRNKYFYAKRRGAIEAAKKLLVQLPSDYVEIKNIAILTKEGETKPLPLVDSGDSIRRINPITTEQHVALHNAENKDQTTTRVTYDYNGFKELINKATSSHDIQLAWRLIKAATWLASWQNRELDKLIQNQRTKIDF